jgi:hypothetical protein
VGKCLPKGKPTTRGLEFGSKSVSDLLGGQGSISTSHTYMIFAVNYQFAVIMSLIANFNYPKPKH